MNSNDQFGSYQDRQCYSWSLYCLTFLLKMPVMWHQIILDCTMPSVIDLDYTRLMRQGLMTNPLVWQGKVDYRKSALDYATLGRAFWNFFLYKTFSRVFINTMIVKTFSSWKPCGREFTYKLISTANIVHTYFSLLTLYVHS